MLNQAEGQAVGAQAGDDPLLYLQWYIDKTGLPNVAVDLNVRPVWDGGGGRSYTGAGVHIGIFDSLVSGRRSTRAGAPLMWSLWACVTTRCRRRAPAASSTASRCAASPTPASISTGASPSTR